MPEQSSIDREKIDEVLRQSPIKERRSPSQAQLRHIQLRVQEAAMGAKRRIIIRIGTAALLFCLVLIAYVIIDEMPGGLADRRMSAASGIDGTFRIPLGRTPEEAVQKFRNFAFMQVVHREPVKGGVLLFIKRGYQQNGTDLQVEYVRRMWLGWKWGMGGGFGYGGDSNDKEALNYMFMPQFLGIRAPFPLVSGEVVDPAVQHINIVTAGQRPGRYAAKLAGSETGHKIWFALLPSEAATPYEIEALNANGDIVASKTITDPRDSGIVTKSAP